MISLHASSSSMAHKPGTAWSTASTSKLFGPFARSTSSFPFWPFFSWCSFWRAPALQTAISVQDWQRWPWAMWIKIPECQPERFTSALADWVHPWASWRRDTHVVDQIENHPEDHHEWMGGYPNDRCMILYFWVYHITNQTSVRKTCARDSEFHSAQGVGHPGLCPMFSEVKET